MSCLRWEEIAIGRFQAGTEVVELSIQYDDVVTRKFPTGGHGLVETITDFYLPRVEWSYYSLGLGEVRKHEVMHAARLSSERKQCLRFFHGGRKGLLREHMAAAFEGG